MCEFCKAEVNTREIIISDENDKTGKQFETLISMQYGYYVQKEVSK